MEAPQSPMNAVAPPSKKQRSSAPLRGRRADLNSSATDDAIARRRAELRRLQQLSTSVNGRAGAGGSKSRFSSAEGLMAQARALQLGGALSSSSATVNEASKSAEPTLPSIPQPNPKILRSRGSDIFPNAPKDTTTEPKRPAAAPVEIAQASTIAEVAPTAPPMSAAAAPSQVKVPSPPTASKESAKKIVRNLDSTFASKIDTSSRAKSAPPARPPQPPSLAPAPPKLVAESHPSTEKDPDTPGPHLRPSPINLGEAKDALNGFGGKQKVTEVTRTPSRSNRSKSTPRADLLRSMRSAADSPPVLAPSVRLVSELKKTQQEKEDAFRKVQRLQEQVILLRNNSNSSMNSRELETVLHLADQKGEVAAVEWVRSQMTTASGTPTTPTKASSSISFLSPERAASGGGAMGKRRIATPHPKREARASGDRDLLVQATEATPDEYDSGAATYKVRRPYGVPSSSKADPNFWNNLADILAANDYELAADADKPMTLEVAAEIHADGSLLVLSGVDTVRHLKAETGTWRHFDHVDAMDKPMGCVMYIDADANEREYWLDEVYEEALSVRETYCSSLVSTASALRRKVKDGSLTSFTQESEASTVPLLMNGTTDLGVREPVELPPPEPIIKEIIKEVYVERPRPEMADAQVDTTDLLPPPEKKVNKSVVPKEEVSQTIEKIPQKAPSIKKRASKKPVPPPEEMVDDAGASSDVLSVMLGWILAGVFGLVWFIMVKVPIRIFTYTLGLAIAAGILSIVWLHAADDHGALHMMGGSAYASGGFGRFNSFGVK